MLHEARRKPGAERVRWLCHDLHAPLPFANVEFDIVVSGLVLEHLRELNGFFAEISRVLTPAGRAVISAMHPAMFLRGSMARFTDPTTGNVVQPGSSAHSISDFLNAAIRTELWLRQIEEVTPDTAFAKRYPRAEKYIGWPMLVVMQFGR
jgi:malonyl-CoA O-methyltransferase